MSNQSVIEALRRRKFSHWILGYAAGAWAVAEATGFAIDNYAAPRRLLDVVLFLILVFFFVLIVLVWYHGEQGPQRVSRREGGLLSSLFAVAAVGSVWIATADGVPAAALAVEDVVVADLGEGSVAVLPFRSTVDASELAWLERALAELLSTHLAQANDLRVVSGQRIFDLLAQLGVQEGEDLPESTEARLMELSGASLIVTGSIYGRRGDLTIVATLVDASTGEIRASSESRGGDVFALVDELSRDLRSQIGSLSASVTLTPTAELTTRDIEAYRAYEDGRLAYSRFHYRDAAEHFGRALELDSAFALARFRRGLTLLQLGEISEATEEVHRARRDVGGLSERDRLFMRGLDLFATDTTMAVATVRELIRKYPDEKDARIIFASILHQLRGASDPEARRLLTETVQLDPSYAAGYNILAYSYAGSGDLTAADSLIRKYVELEPDQPNPWDSKGEILEMAGRHEEAREAYREALRIEPGFRASLNHLIGSYLVQDDAVGARAEIESHVDSPIAEVRIRSLALRGDTHLWEGEIDEGFAAFRASEREAIEADRPDQQAWRLRDITQTHLALGEFTAAAEAAQAVREIEPLDGWWITALYDSLTTSRDVDAMRVWKARVEAEVGSNRLTRSRLAATSRLIDLWIAYAEDRHQDVLSIAAELPVGLRTGVLTEWPVYRSMLATNQTDALLDALQRFQDPNVFLRGPRFLPLQVRWAQYFEARAHEARGDTAAAVAGYEALVDGMGEGLARMPALSDVPARLEALTSSAGRD